MSVVASKSQLAYDFIKERIISGAYSPGYRLVTAAIAGEVGVSTVPVREAIRRLEAERLVTVERNVGAQVAMLDAREYLYTMQTLALVEGYATALAAPLLTDHHLRRAREVNEAMARSLEDFQPHAFTEQNLKFHSVLYEPCPNPHVLDLVHRGWSRMASLRDSTFSFVPGRARQSVEEHACLLELIESDGSASEIEVVARAHRLGTLDALLRYQGDQFATHS
jgi:DNA-binding GntR family transcriptional regulator